MIKTFILNPRNLEKWLYQNKAENTGDFVEGCLLDNWVVMTKRGFAAIYEKYVNPNQSEYLIEWETGPAQNVFSHWYDFEEGAKQ